LKGHNLLTYQRNQYLTDGYIAKLLYNSYIAFESYPTIKTVSNSD